MELNMKNLMMYNKISYDTIKVSHPELLCMVDNKSQRRSHFSGAKNYTS